ncbi:hypothetical protein EDC04DRAFT_2601079 [Pisolithus marmoratus]|nr:hypothetical protein EDC04DRAFT_2601079 [Pisolithus marmoratus]
MANQPHPDGFKSRLAWERYVGEIIEGGGLHAEKKKRRVENHLEIESTQASQATRCNTASFTHQMHATLIISKLGYSMGCIKATSLKAQLPHPPRKKLLLAVNNHCHACKVIATSSRQKNHELTDALGLGRGALPYSDLVTKNNLTIIQHDHIPDQYKCGMLLVDHGNEDLG